MNKVVAEGIKQGEPDMSIWKIVGARSLEAPDARQVQGLGGGGEGGLEMLQEDWQPAGGEAAPVSAWFPTRLLPGLLCALNPTPRPP